MESGGASHPPPQNHQNRPQAANPRWQASQYHPVGHGRAGEHISQTCGRQASTTSGEGKHFQSPSQERASQQPWTGTCDLNDKWQCGARTGTIDPNLKGQASNQAGGVVKSTRTMESPSQERASQQPWTGTCDLNDTWQCEARTGTIDPNLKGQASNQVGGVVICS